MKSKVKENILAVRMYAGENFLTELSEAFKQASKNTGIIMSAAGMLKEIKLGYFMGGGEYRENVFQIPREIVSLTGNIINSEDGFFSHLHVSLADDDGKVIGGHLHKAVVHGTGEVFIYLADMDITRQTEEETKLKGLKL